MAASAPGPYQHPGRISTRASPAGRHDCRELNMSKTYDVIIAGAGPIGLFLAGEVALGGASVLVLERDTVQSPLKAAPLGFRGANTLTIECLARRNLLDKIFPHNNTNLQGMMKKQGAGPPAPTRPFKKTGDVQFGGHFAGLFFDAGKLDLSRWKYRINGPGFVPGPTTMEAVETAFGERAERLGVDILRGCSLARIVSGTESASESVTIDAASSSADTPQTFTARWLVGCDGGHSAVRRTGGFLVDGSEPKFTGYAMRADITNSDKLKPGFAVTDTGMYIAGAFGDTVYVLDADGGAFDRSQELTIEHLQTVLTRVTGEPDVQITALRAATSFTDRCRHATHYRKGRVLLAGDAAHTHATFGAQGMNLGMGDAMNLGWKLAATVRQEKQLLQAPDTTLLDTYDRERLPVADHVLELSRAQTLAFCPDVYGRAVRSLVKQTIDTVDGANLFMGNFWGLNQKYDLSLHMDDMAEERQAEREAMLHPLVGRSAPDFVLDRKATDDKDQDDGSDDNGDRLRLNHKLWTGRGLLVDLADDAGRSGLKSFVEDSSYADLVDYLAAPTVVDKLGLQAFLVRPDGMVAWAVDEGQAIDVSTMKAVLNRWFSF
ncbi:pentachlorophenol 4-monooxygenase [Ophiostoma piceae UAMH 11346]|uniref:Pentachlorophenol 4-monooxygenase n=1 Tax=Ophiostoma piceae (strain UAMH 11346) TaxID=1262450 RepID=S3D8R0_OPHP1|nr:pentachlorophenol 4-monooxygenase [Ophiostoma piceae UAMH 11346]